MTLKKLIILLASLTFIAPSCVNNAQMSKKNRGKISTGSRPDWVDGKSSEFPRSRYLIAIGHSRNRKEAENQTRAEMSQIFLTKIKAVRNSVKHGHSIRKNGKVNLSAIELKVDSTIKNETQSIFSGMELVRYWKSPSGTIYVLGVIDKQKVIPLLLERIKKLDNIIRQRVEDAQKTNDKLERVISLNKTLEKAVLREYYNTQMAIMKYGPVKTDYDVDTLLYMIDKAVAEISVSVSISGEGNKTFRYAIIKILGDMGFRVNEDTKNIQLDDFEDFGEDTFSKNVKPSKNTDIAIEGSVSFRAADRGDGAKWVTGNLEITLKNNKNSKIYSTIMINKKFKAKTLQDARRIVGAKMIKKLQRKFKKDFLKLLTQKNKIKR